VKKSTVLAFLAFLVLGAAATFISAADVRGKIDLQVGQEAWFCACDKCPCESVSRQPGKCSCNVDMVKGKVTAVDANAGVATADLGGGMSKTFKMTGKYACACDKCPCGMVSQQPGNCSCGKPMTPMAPAAAPATGGYGTPAPAPAAPAPSTGGYGK
jgi:hypothetical protein